LDLVIACHFVEPHRQAVEEWGRELGLTDSLKLTGYVSDEELRALYGLCRLFFFPSLYEGLGLPVLEAFRCGAPVVAATRSALPEASGPVSWLADPESSAETAAALAAALTEPREARRAERLAHAGRFTWEGTAERAARTLELLPAVSFAPRRKRVAWVS